MEWWFTPTGTGGFGRLGTPATGALELDSSGDGADMFIAVDGLLLEW